MGLPWSSTDHWRVVQEASEALGEDLAWLLLDAPDAVLARTREAQLAVFCNSMVAWDAVRPLVESPVVFAGHSLGQVSALVAAGSLSLADGVRLVARRAEVTQAAADSRPGRLVALIGADLDSAEALCEGLDGAWVANDNAVGQVVVGGTPEAMDAVAARAGEFGVRRTIALNVGGAFHTPLMATAAEELAETLSDMDFAAPAAPVVSNTDGRAHTDGAGWAERLAAQLVSPVRWRSCMATIDSLCPDSLLELGPGGVLAGLARRCASHVPVRPVAEPADLVIIEPAGVSGSVVAEVA